MTYQTLSRKQLLKDSTALVNEWLQQNHDSALANRVFELNDALSALQDDKSVLDEQQNALKGAVGRAKRAGQPAEDLIAQMRESADRLKPVKASIHDTADLLLELLRANDPDVSTEQIIPAAPGQFLSPQLSDCHKGPESGETDVEIVAVEDISAAQWDSYVANHPAATHYHQYQWREIIKNNFPQQHFHIAVRDCSGSIKGVMSIVYMNSRVSGSYLLSMPWLIYGGSLASDDAASSLLCQYAIEKMTKIDCSHIELRQVHARSDWQLMPGKASMVLTLPDSTNALNDGFGASLRSQIRAAAAVGPAIEFGGSELVDDFYNVFCEKMRDLGTPVYHKGFFVDIVAEFADSTTVVIVRLNGRAVAAAILMKYRNTIEIPWAAARKRYNPQGVNMFMYHQILEYSVQQGFQFFDFGRSGIDSGTYQFKKQWGAQPYKLGWHRYPSTREEGSDYPVENMSLKFRVAIGVWKRLPVWVTKVIGPPVSRHLPW